jgi:hypothetical protein
MSKFTRRFKKNKKNRTIKRGGNSDSSENQKNIEESQKEDREGVIDMIENKVSDAASSASKKITDVGLKFIGLERINKNDEEDKTIQNVEENANNVSNIASGIVSNVGNVVDKTGAVVIGNVNEVLGSNIVKESTQQAAENTAGIVKEGAEKFNDALNKPEVKAEVEKAIENAGEIGSVIVKSAEKPLNDAVEVASKASQKATSAALSGIVKVGTDVLAAVPFFGAIIDAGKMVNDGSRAVSAVFEAGTEATEAASDAFIATKKNIENGLKALEEQKKIGNQTLNRANLSMKEFENSSIGQSAGGRKTKRNFFKRKAKSKRVRFAI